MPEITDVNKLVKDAAYAAVGFGVLGFQRAQVRRRELVEQLESLGSTGSELRSQLAERLGSVHLEGLKLENLKLENLKLDGLKLDGLKLDGAGAEQVAALRTQVLEAAKRVDAQVQPLRQQVEGRLDEVEELLPAPTRTVVRQIRSAAKSQEQALRNVIGLSA